MCFCLTQTTELNLLRWAAKAFFLHTHFYWRSVFTFCFKNVKDFTHAVTYI